MSDELDPVVFEVLAMVQEAIDSLNEVKDLLASAAADMAQMAANFEASSAEASAAVSGIAVKTEETAAKVRESQAGMAEGFKMMLEAAGAFAAYDFLKDSISAANEAASAEVILEQVTKNTGGSYEELKPKIESVNEQMRALGYTNAQSTVGLSKMAQTVGGVPAALNLMGLATDIARARNIDLNSAIRLVGMAATGHVAMLSRLGIQTKDAAGKTLTAQQALDKLSQTYKGTAQAYAGSMQGQMAVMHAQLDQSKEKIGNQLLPILTKLLPAFSNIAMAIMGAFVPALSAAAKLYSSNSTLINTLVIALVAAYTATKVWSALIAVWEAVTKAAAAITVVWNAATTLLTTGQWELNAALDANPIGVVIGLIAALAAALAYAWNHSQTFRDAVVGAWNDIEAAAGGVVSFVIMDAIKPLVDAFLSMAKSIVDSADSAFGWADPTGSLDSAKNAVDSFANDTDSTLSAWAASASSWGNSVSNTMNSTAAAIAKANNAPLDAGKAIASSLAPSVTHAAKIGAAHVAHAQNTNAKILANHKKHVEAMLALEKEHERKRDAILKAQIAHLKNLLAAQKALQNNAQQNLNIVNGQYANVGTSLMNLGYASAPSAVSAPPVVNVTVQGTVVAQQQLITAVQQGLLQTQRTNASLGIKGK